ncbi:MAG: alpha-glucan family phosphorylase [Desulfobulbaceae bacterium]|nr:alpha-glucan family phosphorylase [Desulfobulbaceae bacterium]
MKTNDTISSSKLIAKTQFGTFFGVPQHIFDQVWSSLCEKNGNSAIYISMEIGADPDVFHPLQNHLLKNEITNVNDQELQNHIDKFLFGPRKIPNYSGGLGVLAGDTLKSFADLHFPAAAISILYREGYFSQIVDSHVGQIDQATHWSPHDTPTLYLLHEPDSPEKPLEIDIPFPNNNGTPSTIRAQVWMKLELNENLDYFVPEFLLDYDLESSPPLIKDAAQRLYNSKSPMLKAIQRRMLGSGVMPLMEALGLSARTIHLNEQHGVTATLNMILTELTEKLGPDYRQTMSDKDIMEAVSKVSQKVVYTIHTPVKAGHDRFTRDLYAEISQDTCQRMLNLLADDQDSPHEYNFTALAMRINRAVNAVSRLHRNVTRRQFPKYADKITAITNGVHHLTWISDQRAKIFDSHQILKNWRNDPGCFATEKLFNSESFRHDLSRAWQLDNQFLIEYINNMLIEHRNQMMETWIDPPNYLSHLIEEGRLEPGVFTIGFARRFSTYKRADLIFDDIPYLASILVKGGWRVNFVFAGKAHPQDEPGQSVLKLILDNQQELYTLSKGLAKLIFIPNYDMKMAKMMVAGVHAWLNSPKRPLEASGTSGMKAAINGVPNVSVMDGWWEEGYHDGATGWKFGYEGPVEEANLSEDADSLYYAEDSHAFYKLLPSMLQSFYEHPETYMDKALKNLQLNLPIFNTHRMAAEYILKYKHDLDQNLAERIEYFSSLYQSDINGN